MVKDETMVTAVIKVARITLNALTPAMPTTSPNLLGWYAPSAAQAIP